MILTRQTKFDIVIHKKNFTNYTEVIILKDGTVEYAVPSHQQKLIELTMKEFNMTEEELNKAIPITESPTDWCVVKLGAISVWYEFIIRPEDITKEQTEMLEKFKTAGIIRNNYGETILYLGTDGRIYTRLD